MAETAQPAVDRQGQRSAHARGEFPVVTSVTWVGPVHDETVAAAVAFFVMPVVT